jgi:hypothetical protein
VAAEGGAAGVVRVIHLRTLHVGPDEILVAAKIAVAETGTAAVAPDSDSNRSNPALARQASSPKKNKTETDE